MSDPLHKYVICLNDWLVLFTFGRYLNVWAFNRIELNARTLKGRGRHFPPISADFVCIIIATIYNIVR